MLWLSIVVINGGAAWASQNCLARGESLYHAHIASGSDLEHDHKLDARIHCPESSMPNLALGPASFVFRLEPPKNGAGGWLNTGSLSLNALLNWTFARSFKPHLSASLFLSKLRI